MKKLIWAAAISALLHVALLGSDLQWLRSGPQKTIRHQNITVNMLAPVHTKSGADIESADRLETGTNHSQVTPGTIIQQKDRREPADQTPKSVLHNPSPKKVLQQKVETKAKKTDNQKTVPVIQKKESEILEQAALLETGQQAGKERSETEFLLGQNRKDSTHEAVVEAVPMYDINPSPPYPSMARRRGLAGTVILNVLVSNRGDVDRLSIHQSSGYKVLDKTALKAVNSWKFKPGKQGGKVISMHVLVPVSFELR